MKDLLIFLLSFTSSKSSFVHCGAVSRHLTTDETAEKSKTTTNALVIVLEVWMSTYTWTM